MHRSLYELWALPSISEYLFQENESPLTSYSATLMYDINISLLRLNWKNLLEVLMLTS